MKFTWHWLLDHLQTDKNLNEIVEALPKLGLEVASVINLAEELKEFISQHPEKDQLSQIVDKIFRAKPRQRRNEEYDKSRDQKGIIQRLGSLFSRD